MEGSEERIVGVRKEYMCTMVHTLLAPRSTSNNLTTHSSAGERGMVGGGKGKRIRGRDGDAGDLSREKDG